MTGSSKAVTLSPEEAVRRVRSGDHVWIGTGAATPRTLARALHAMEPAPRGVTLTHSLTDGSLGEKPSSRFRHRAFVIGRELGALPRGVLDYLPVSLLQAHQLISSGQVPVDVAMVRISPPDGDGRVNLGVSVELNRIAIERARLVIGEVTPSMPRTAGDGSIPVEDFDVLVESREPLATYLHQPADAVAARIARYVARIIDDGSTLQVGLGRIPNEMLKYLGNRRDLGIHSDVISESLVDLMDSGAVTGARKNIDTGRVVASYAFGSPRLYQLLDGNDQFLMRPINQVADPAVIAHQERMVAVGQAFSIDLTGQVCADQFDNRFYGGIGCMPEFFRGASSAPAGKSILCLASVSDDGCESRIRARLLEGEGVTIPRNDVHFVVTEWGVAYLFGRSIEERAIALIEIAHPDFRDGLLDEAKRLGWIRQERRLESRTSYPVEEERDIELTDGSRVLLRPTRASDVESIQTLFHDLPPEDVFTRFFTKLESLSVSHAQHLASVDYQDEMALVAVVGRREHEQVVASACYYLDPSTGLGDVAYMVHPDWQGRGLATRLQSRLIEYARSRGVRGFKADVLCDNAAMLAVLERSRCRIDKRVSGATWEVTMIFPPDPEPLG